MVQDYSGMKSIGGYFELECGRTPLYHEEGIYLNSCRNAIRYLIRTLGIKRLHIPYYTCRAVEDSITREGCEIRKYYLDRDLMPAAEFPKDDFIIYNNYFGVAGKNVKALADIYPNLIADNAQAFYSKPECRATVYSPRKFFGLPDGGILRGMDIPAPELDKGVSADVTSHLLKRLDYGARSGYPDFVANDRLIDRYPLLSMSNLTRAVMGNIDYERAKERRLENFHYLEKRLPSDFPVSLSSDDVPLVYPYLVDDGDSIRTRLIDNNIFCARYWPETIRTSRPGSLEYNLAKNMVAIPIDQRYGLREMKEIADFVNTL